MLLNKNGVGMKKPGFIGEKFNIFPVNKRKYL